jgi:hypothetical protein
MLRNITRLAASFREDVFSGLPIWNAQRPACRNSFHFQSTLLVLGRNFGVALRLLFVISLYSSSWGGAYRT